MDALNDLLESALAARGLNRFPALVDAVSAQLGRVVFYDDALADEQELVHYTSWKRALAILRDDRPVLRMYNYELSNDPQEGVLWRRAFDRLNDETMWLHDYLPEYEKTLLDFDRNTGSTFGCSFSSDVGGVEDNLTFWRLYGNDGIGCSFKVTGRLLKGSGMNVYRVRYLNEDRENADPKDELQDHEVASRLENLVMKSRDLAAWAREAERNDVATRIATGIRKILGGYHHLAKSEYYKDEREWRMIEVDPIKKSINYEVGDDGVVRRYVPGLDLKKVLATDSSVTIGPQVPNAGAARAYVEHLVREMGMAGTDVRLSKRPYRSGH